MILKFYYFTKIFISFYCPGFTDSRKVNFIIIRSIFGTRLIKYSPKLIYDYWVAIFHASDSKSNKIVWNFLYLDKCKEIIFMHINEDWIYIP